MPGSFQLNSSGSGAGDDEANRAETSPNSRSEMRQNLLSKLRSPPLVHSWDFWHDRQSRGQSAPSNQAKAELFNNPSGDKSQPRPKYEDRLMHLTTISDVRGFWEMFNNFDIAALPLRDSVHLFHKGVKPVWEDARNARGGSWTFRVPKEKAADFWREVCMMAIGEQLQEAVKTQRKTFVDDICGVGLSVRFTSILVQIWNRDGEHTDGIDRILSTVMDTVPAELKPNDSSHYYKRHVEHASFSDSTSSGSTAGLNSSKTASLTRNQDMPDAPRMPPNHMSLGGKLDIQDEERAKDIRARMAPPGEKPSPDTGKSDAEALQDVDNTLSSMKDAMDVIANKG